MFASLLSVCLALINHRSKLTARAVPTSLVAQSLCSEPPPYLMLTHPARVSPALTSPRQVPDN